MSKKESDESNSPNDMPWWFFAWIGYMVGSLVTFAICVNAPYLKEVITQWFR